MAKRIVTSVVVDFDSRYLVSGIVGFATFWRNNDANRRRYEITPRTVARALEAQRLMLAKIEAQKVVSNE
jgi:hypothetical protein